METNRQEQFYLEGIPPKAEELDAIDNALRDAAEYLTDANKHYGELIMARIALREVIRRGEIK